MIGAVPNPLTDRRFSVIWAVVPLPSSGIWAVALASLAISVLLAADEQNTDTQVDTEKVTFAGLLYLMLVKRKPLTVLLVLGVVGVVLGSYYLSQAIGVTFETEGNSFTVKLPGATVYYFPIHSQSGWQNTGIILKKDQQFKYAITGSVNLGYLQNIDQRSRNLRIFKLKGVPYKDPHEYWPFKGPEGFDDEWYELLRTKDMKACEDAYGDPQQQKEYGLDPKNISACYNTATKSYKDDTGLTVQGVPHNRVVGILLEKGSPPPNTASGSSAIDSKPGYRYGDGADKEKLLLFKANQETSNQETSLQKMKAYADGELWVVINDADAYRWDNVGIFFLKIIVP
jgi:hypothetical protein